MFSFFRARKKENRKKAPGRLRRVSRSVAPAGGEVRPRLTSALIRLYSAARFKRGNRALKTGTPENAGKNQNLWAVCLALLEFECILSRQF